MSTVPRWLGAVFLVLAWTGSVSGQVANAVKFVEKLASRTARTTGADAVPLVLREADTAAAWLTRSATMADEIVESRFQRLTHLDPGLRAEFRTLAPAEQRLAVELGEEVQAVLRRYPDEAGLDLVQRLGTEGLIQARTYGDFVVEGAHWLHTDEVAAELCMVKLTAKDAAALSRTLGLAAQPETLQPEHLAPLWKSTIRKTEHGAGIFWKTYVQPHPEPWLAGGLLATYLIRPEWFHDSAGRLTEQGSRQLTEMGLDVSSEKMPGAVQRTLDAFQNRYAEHPVTTVLVVILAVILLLLAVPPIRHVVGGWVSRLLRRDVTASGKPSGFRTHTPFRE